MVVMTGRYKTQVTGHRSRSQVTGNRKRNKKVRHFASFLCLFICFISGYVTVTIRHMFGIDHSSGCSKRTNYQKLHIVLELEELLLSFGCRETSKRCVVFAPPGGTWIEDRWNGKIASLMQKATWQKLRVSR